MNHKKGDKVRGADQVDHRLRHLHRPAWRHRRSGSPVRPVVERTGEEAIRNFKKGDEVEAMVLGIDVEKERISLGIKQMDGDPYTNFIATHEKNSIVRATVKSVDARGAVMALDGDNEGYLRASEFSRDRIDDLSQHLKVGDELLKHDHQRGSQDPRDQSVDQGQGSSRTARSHAEVLC
jgi:small subunit ribosomal protein S1